MLNGLWAIEITDERGAHAGGLVIFCDGAVFADGSTIDIDGAYDVHDDAILAALDVVLHGTGQNGEPMAERAHLHVQGWAIGRTIFASGIDLADDTRRVRVYLDQRRASPASPGAPSSIPPVEPESKPTATLSPDTVEKLGAGTARPEAVPVSDVALAGAPGHRDHK